MKVILRSILVVFNASDNFGKLHRLEIRPKSRQFLVNSEWNSDDVNVHPVLLKARSPEKLMDVGVFERRWFSFPQHDDQNVQLDRE